MATRIEKLGARRLDSTITTAKLLNEAWRTIQQSDSVRYVVGAMQQIDPEYTKNTYAQGDRVQNQLAQRLPAACDYEYQGSVTNGTHIRAKSDIDLLVITQKYWSLEPPQQAKNPYAGDPVADLLVLRKDTTAALTAGFPEAVIDATGSKSIVVSGGSLTRKIDVVPSNWYDTIKYVETSSKVYRGIHILDAANKTRIANTPFLHNALIEAEDQRTNGGLRKAARLLKSLKYDSDINLSSYDLVSIAYSIPTQSLTVQRGEELTLLGTCLDHCRYLESDAAVRSTLKVPDQHRAIFSDGHATAAGLNALTRELSQLASDVLNENQRSFRKLAEARVEY